MHCACIRKKPQNNNQTNVLLLLLCWKGQFMYDKYISAFCWSQCCSSANKLQNACLTVPSTVSYCNFKKFFFKKNPTHFPVPPSPLLLQNEKWDKKAESNSQHSLKPYQVLLGSNPLKSVVIILCSEFRSKYFDFIYSILLRHWNRSEENWFLHYIYWCKLKDIYSAAGEKLWRIFKIP